MVASNKTLANLLADRLGVDGAEIRAALADLIRESVLAHEAYEINPKDPSEVFPNAASLRDIDWDAINRQMAEIRKVSASTNDNQTVLDAISEVRGDIKALGAHKTALWSVVGLTTAVGIAIVVGGISLATTLSGLATSVDGLNTTLAAVDKRLTNVEEDVTTIRETTKETDGNLRILMQHHDEKLIFPYTD